MRVRGRLIERDPEVIYQIDPRKWEELIAGASRSGDFGRDVIATMHGVGTVRIYDQVKAYKPGHVVAADDVRAMGGVLLGFPNVSKAVITTTSTFAPRIARVERATSRAAAARPPLIAAQAQR